jgi:two-component system sensor histidine kinase KdpD
MVVALGAIMFAVRSHLSVATTALVLIVPVVAGVAIGGFTAGVVATAAGFLVYDFVFIPPYYTLYVGAAQNWTALAVYAVVMVITARVVAQLKAARMEAQGRAAEVRRLFDLSELLVRESPLTELLETIVGAVQQAFSLDGAALLLPSGGVLKLVASVGTPLSKEELGHLGTADSTPVSLETARVRPGDVQAVPLVASGEAIALLALRGLPPAGQGKELLQAFANHLALALERAQLREEAVRAQLLGEVDRLRRSLVGAVSHDLRTPLASIKVSASTLSDPEASVNAADVRELAGLIDEQADRLERLVSNLLDMTRIQSGALELRRQPSELRDLFVEALSLLGPSVGDRVSWLGAAELPLVDVDHLLVRQVLANLIDNATRYSPPDSKVVVDAVPGPDRVVEVSVSDDGAGIPAEERSSIFEMFNQSEAGGRGGLGLAIAQAFVDAHGQRIWVDEAVASGARFVFTLPVYREARST